MTPDRTVRLLQRAMEGPGLSSGVALPLVADRIRRDEIARRSHTTTWLAGHEKVKSLPL